MSTAVPTTAAAAPATATDCAVTNEPAGGHSTALCSKNKSINRNIPILPLQDNSINTQLHPSTSANYFAGGIASTTEAELTTTATTTYKEFNASSTYDEMPQIPANIRITAMCFCISIMVLGVIGNIMVPIVIAKTKDMRNSTNIFLTNLSIADLLVLVVCTPTVLVEVNTRPETWVLGHELCKAVPFIELTVAHASVLTILAISFERYYAICEPLKAGYVCTKARAILICLLAWSIAALFTSPILWVAEYKFVEYIDGSSVAVCLTQAITNWTIGFFISMTSIFFILPLIILIILYGIIAKNLISNTGPTMMRIRPTKPELSLKARKQVVLMLGAVVLFFFVCLLPFRVFTIWIIFSSEQTIFEIGMERYYTMLYLCRVFLYLNSAINPILYNLMSTKFRKGFLKLSCNVWEGVLGILTCGRRGVHGTHRFNGNVGAGGGVATNTTTSSNNVTTTSSSILSRTSNNRRPSTSVVDDGNTISKTRIQIQMQIPYACGSDNEMVSMLHAIDDIQSIVAETDDLTERDYDGAEVALCYMPAETFWPVFYFVGSIVVFFAMPFIILVLLYAAIAYKLLRRGSAFHRPTSPTSSLPPVGPRQRQRRGGIVSAAATTFKINSHQQMRQHRQQVILMLVAVVVSFFVCLLPFRAFILWVLAATADDIARLGIDWYYALLYICRCMLYLNSALNPILYNLMSSKFRNGFWRLIVSCCGVGGDNSVERRNTAQRQGRTLDAATLRQCSINDSEEQKCGRQRLLQRDGTFVVSSISTSSGTERTSASSSSWRSGSLSTSVVSASIQPPPPPLPSSTVERSVGAAIMHITDASTACINGWQRHNK